MLYAYQHFLKIIIYLNLCLNGGKGGGGDSYLNIQSRINDIVLNGSITIEKNGNQIFREI